MEFITIVSGIISIIVLISFWIATSNIAAILKNLDNNKKYKNEFDVAVIYELNNSKEEAIKHYVASYYYYKKYELVNLSHKEIQKNKHLSLLVKKITDLGGKLPENI